MSTETTSVPAPVVALTGEPAYAILSQRQLIWRKFKRHRVALISLYALVALYLIVLLAEFVAPYGAFQRHSGYLLAPPTPTQFDKEEWKWR